MQQLHIRQINTHRLDLYEYHLWAWKLQKPSGGFPSEDRFNSDVHESLEGTVNHVLILFSYGKNEPQWYQISPIRQRV